MEYVVSGGGFVECEGRLERFSAGDIYMLPPGKSNSYGHDPAMPWEKLFFVADGRFCDELFHIHGFDGFVALRRCWRLRHFFEEFLLLPQNDSRKSAIAGAALLHSFLAEAALLRDQENSGTMSHAEKLRERLESASNDRLVIAEYARSVGISREHLIRSFREVYGETPYGFQLRRRLETASRLLRYTELSVKEIAYRLDFCGPGYFAVCFRKKFNMTPRQWRNSFRRDGD